jgi:protease I
VTTVPKCAMDAEQGGATYVNEPVVVDGKLVTARGYQDNTGLLREFMRMLKQQS